MHPHWRRTGLTLILASVAHAGLLMLPWAGRGDAPATTATMEVDLLVPRVVVTSSPPTSPVTAVAARPLPTPLPTPSAVTTPPARIPPTPLIAQSPPSAIGITSIAQPAPPAPRTELPATPTTPNTVPPTTVVIAATASEATVARRESREASAREHYRDTVRAHLERYKTYPMTARRARQEGTVRVRVVTAADGSLLEHEVTTASLYPLLDRAALATVERAAPFPVAPADLPDTRYVWEFPLHFQLN